MLLKVKRIGPMCIIQLSSMEDMVDFRRMMAAAAIQLEKYEQIVDIYPNLSGETSGLKNKCVALMNLVDEELADYNAENSEYSIEGTKADIK